jgi:3-deoxy-manno-octulosonate cytidylyltransferase (CMP-KDO synthetase)
MAFSVIIPARYASSRLPGKPLLMLAGKPMIQHVYERAQASGADEVIIATDDQRIQQSAQAFGATVAMTSAEHPSGSDRLAEVVAQRGYPADKIIVNLQGDEPMMPASLIRQVADNLQQHTQASVSTLCERITSAADLFDPHVVKVVIDRNGLALTFSRAAIPWDRDAFSVTTEELPQRSEHYRHIGLYAYRAGFITDYVQWPPCALEQMESLEQLRVLWQGRRIHVAMALESPGHGVDTEADFKRAEQLLLS